MSLSLHVPVAVPVADLARTARFYDAFARPMGFRRLARAGPYLGYTNGPITFWFVAADRAPATEEAPSGEERDHLAFEVGSESEVRALAAALDGQGLVPHRQPDEHRDLRAGAYSAVWLDPDGAIVEVYAPLRRRAPAPTIRPARRRD